MTNLLTRFFDDDSGATAIEYGLIAALIAVAAVGTLTTLGENLDKVFIAVKDKLVITGG